MTQSEPSTASHNTPNPPCQPPPPATLFVFDTGTTGTHPSLHRIQSLSLLLYDPASTPSNPSPHFYQQVRPPSLPDSKLVRSFPHVWRDALEFIRLHTKPATTPLLVAHNAPFDAAFLAAEIDRAKPCFDSPLPPLLFSDSLPLARKALPQTAHPAPYSQESLAERFNISVPKKHHADEDVRVLAQVLHGLDAVLCDGRTSLFKELGASAVDLETMAERYSSRPSSNSLVPDPRFPYVVERSSGYYHTKADCYMNRSLDKQLEGVLEPDPWLSPCPHCVTKAEAARWLEEANGSKEAPCVGSTLPQTEGSYITASSSVSPARLKPTYSSSSQESRRTHPKLLSHQQTIITTRTGKYYHRKVNCVWLSRAKELIPVVTVEPHLAPCPKCWHGNSTLIEGDHEVTFSEVSASTRQSDLSSCCNGKDRVCNYPDGSVDKQVIITTRTGKYYHGKENCVWLKRAKELIPVSAIEPHLAPCPKCWQEKSAPVEETREVTIAKSSNITRTSSTSLAYEARVRTGDDTSGPVARQTIITTRTGKYYHGKDDCPSLKRAKELIPVSAVGPHLAPCPQCWRRKPAPIEVEHVITLYRGPSTITTTSEAPDVQNDLGLTNHTSNESMPTVKSKILTTRTGKYYHGKDECVWLTRAKGLIPVAAVAPHLTPCPKCWCGPSAPVEEAQTELSFESSTTTTKSASSSVRGALKQSDSLTHDEMVETELHPSPVSVIPGDKSYREEYSGVVKSLTEFSEAPRTKEASLEPFRLELYKTRTGLKFHVSEDCQHVKGRNIFVCSPVEEELDPCRDCALGVFQEWKEMGWINGQ